VELDSPETPVHKVTQGSPEFRAQAVHPDCLVRPVFPAGLETRARQEHPASLATTPPTANARRAPNQWWSNNAQPPPPR
jgi:hypothetical protein